MNERLDLMRFGSHALVAVTAFVFVAPVLWLGLTAFRAPADLFSFSLFFKPTWQNFASVLSTYDMVQFFLNSIYVAVVVTIGSILIGGLAAYGFARFPFPFSTVLFASSQPMVRGASPGSGALRSQTWSFSSLSHFAFSA